MTPRQTCPRPDGVERNLRSKTRWFTGFCNSHQVSHFATFFIDARAEISVAESRFVYTRLKSRARTSGTPSPGPSGTRAVCPFSLALLAPVFVWSFERDGRGEGCAAPERATNSRAAPAPNWRCTGAARAPIRPPIQDVRVQRSHFRVGFDNDPSAGSPTETLLRLLLPLNDKVQWTSRDVAGSEPPTSPRSEHFTGPFNR